MTTMVAVAATSIHGGQFFHGKYFSWGGNLVTPLVDRISEFLFVLNCNYGHIVYGVSFLRLIEITVENRDLFHILLHNPALGKTAANIFVIFFSQPSQIPSPERGVSRRCRKSSPYSHTAQARTNRRKSDLNSGAHHVTLARNVLLLLATGIPVGRYCFPARHA